jgi:glutamine amidotransferase
MCLAIYKPKDKKVKKQWLENGFNANPNGAGFAWTDGVRVNIVKGLFTFEQFWKSYKPWQDRACVIHFRLATHGQIDEQNCHPWALCNGEYAVIHNGILNIQSTPQMSDTGHFVNLVLEPAVKAMGLRDPVLRYLVEQAIGSGNKIVVLRPDGEAVFFHEKEGMWLNGVWFSNSSYEGPKAWKPWFDRKDDAMVDCCDGIGDWGKRRTVAVGQHQRDLFGGDSEEEELIEYYESLGMTYADSARLARKDVTLNEPF